MLRFAASCSLLQNAPPPAYTPHREAAGIASGLALGHVRSLICAARTVSAGGRPQATAGRFLQTGGIFAGLPAAIAHYILYGTCRQVYGVLPVPLSQQHVNALMAAGIDRA